MAKITVRKVETYTAWEATQAVDLEMEEFKNQDPPFEGESEEEFLQYLAENCNDLFDSAYSDGATLSEESKNGLSELYQGNRNVISDSRNDQEDCWLESGEVNEEYRKTGGFNVKHDTRE